MAPPRDRDHEQVAIRSGLDVGDHAEVSTDGKALALGEVVLCGVVGHAILETRILHRDLVAVAGELEAEEIAADRERRRRTDEEVAVELRPSARLDMNPIPAGGTAYFQLNSGSL
ncbi:MAG TPA: hypothetical protein VGR87_01440 [Candidatus Limnocylindria bacterium]|jgi:hypothetical protein|nr:hypothetical protein [Candidatus Limnocylindria bacterium]